MVNPAFHGPISERICVPTVAVPTPQVTVQLLARLAFVPVPHSWKKAVEMSSLVLRVQIAESCCAQILGVSVPHLAEEFLRVCHFLKFGRHVEMLSVFPLGECLRGFVSRSCKSLFTG